MKNIIATIPKSRFPGWEKARAVVERCDGETIWPGEEKPRWWTIRMPRLPKENLIGSLCYMVYDGQVRGYFDIVDTDDAANWTWYSQRNRKGKLLICANWHPVVNGPEMNGFQGWRYTALRL